MTNLNWNNSVQVEVIGTISLPVRWEEKALDMPKGKRLQAKKHAVVGIEIEEIGPLTIFSGKVLQTICFRYCWSKAKIGEK